MTIRPVLLTAVFLCAMLPAVAPCAGMRSMSDAQAIVRFDPPLKGAAEEVLRIYPAVHSELLKELGWETAFRPEIVLLKDHASFRKSSGSDLVTALAVPHEDLIVIDYSKMGTHPFTLGVTLKHELCHLELHHAISAERLPRWFDEGICQWVTGGFGEIIGDGSRSGLREAVLSKRLVSIEGLATRFAGDGRDLLLAYEESRSIIEYIKKKFGVSGLRKILEQMRNGDDLESAVRNGLGVSLDELERQWRASLSPGTAWLFYLRDYLYEILFLAAALLTICGFFRVLKKKRDYKDDEQEGEGGEGHGGDGQGEE
ncbi:MAG: peptidase MA family metallohydrolase [Thermodesulfovibrionales bacterium]